MNLKDYYVISYACNHYEKKNPVFKINIVMQNKEIWWSNKKIKKQILLSVTYKNAYMA